MSFSHIVPLIKQICFCSGVHLIQNDSIRFLLNLSLFIPFKSIPCYLRLTHVAIRKILIFSIFISIGCYCVLTRNVHSTIHHPMCVICNLLLRWCKYFIKTLQHSLNGSLLLMLFRLIFFRFVRVCVLCFHFIFSVTVHGIATVHGCHYDMSYVKC